MDEKILGTVFNTPYEKEYEMSRADKLDRALDIACALLHGNILYGIDKDSIFEYMLAKDGCVGFYSYREFIIENLDRFSDVDEIRHKAVEKLGW